jgi:MFS family permease
MRRRDSLATSIKSELTENAKIWLTAFAAMIAYTPCAGTLTSFPVSANYLKTQMGASQETINTISSLAFGFTVGLCPVSSMLFKKIGYRNVGILGVFGVAFSMGLSVFATQVWQVYLTYSLMFGFFNNCAYNGLISFVGDQFLGTSYVASATALFGCGISLGTMIFSSAGTSIMMADITNGWRNRSLLHAICAIIAGFIFVILTNHANNLKNSIGDEPEEHVTNKLVQAGAIASESNEARTITYRAIKAGVNELEESVPPSEKSDSKHNCKISVSKQTISRTNLTGAVNQVSNKAVSKLLPECFSTNSMYLAAFWLWLVGTFVWSSTYTIPYSTANSWPEFQCSVVQNQTFQIPRATNCQDGMRTAFLGQMMTILGLYI